MLRFVLKNMSVKAFEELVQNHAVAAPVRQTTLLLLDKLAENDKDAVRNLMNRLFFILLFFFFFFCFF